MVLARYVLFIILSLLCMSDVFHSSGPMTRYVSFWMARGWCKLRNSRNNQIWL